MGVTCRGAGVALCVVLMFGLLSCSAQAPQEQNQTRDWNISQPLRICTSSIQDFGARCNGNAGVPLFEKETAPLGPVPAGGWCAAGEDFCGFDIDVWRCGAPLQPCENVPVSLVSCHLDTGVDRAWQSLLSSTVTLLYIYHVLLVLLPQWLVRFQYLRGYTVAIEFVAMSGGAGPWPAILYRPVRHCTNFCVEVDCTMHREEVRARSMLT